MLGLVCNAQSDKARNQVRLTCSGYVRSGTGYGAESSYNMHRNGRDTPEGMGQGGFEVVPQCNFTTKESEG